MIEIEDLIKAVRRQDRGGRLSFVVEPGTVTGFLGPNGAGKSTTMRMIAGLDAADDGTVRVNGKHYRPRRAPMAELGICSRRRRSTPAARPATTCSRSRGPPASGGAGSTR